jgi:hypothetical protein
MKGVKSKIYPQKCVWFATDLYVEEKMGKVWDEVKYCSDKCRSNK